MPPGLPLPPLRPVTWRHLRRHNPHPHLQPEQVEGRAWEPQTKGRLACWAPEPCTHKSSQFPPIEHILTGGGTRPCFPVKPERRGWGHFHQVAVRSPLGGQMDGLVLWPRASGVPGSPRGTFWAAAPQGQQLPNRGWGKGRPGRDHLDTHGMAPGRRARHRRPTSQVRGLRLRERKRLARFTPQSWIRTPATWLHPTQRVLAPHILPPGPSR